MGNLSTFEAFVALLYALLVFLGLYHLGKPTPQRPPATWHASRLVTEPGQGGRHRIHK